MELWKYYRVLYRRKWLILIGVVLCMAVALALVLTQPAKYTGVARVMERTPVTAGSTTFQEGVYSGVTPELRLSNLARIARSNTVLQGVGEKLRNEQGYQWDQAEMRKNVSIVPERETQLLLITATHEDREVAARTANLIASEFGDYYRQILYNPGEQSKYLQGEVQRAKQSMDDVLAQMAAYKKAHNLSNLEYKGQVELQRLSELETQFRQSQALTREATQRLSAAQEALNTLPRTREEQKTTGDNSLWLTLTNELARKEQDLASMLAYRGEGHPEVKALRESIEDLKTKRAEETRERMVSKTEGANPVYSNAVDRFVQAKVDALGTQAKTAALGAIVPEVRARLANYPEEERTLTELTIQAKAAQDTYALLRQKWEEAKVRESEPFAAGKIEMVDAADPRTMTPAGGRKLKLMLALPLSILLSIAVIFLLDYLDNSVRTPEQAEELLGLPVAAMVPISKHHSLIKGLPDPGLRESYQMLSAGLWHQAVKDAGRGALAIASAEPNSGRTITAGNLAAALAGDGARVILVDGDMRQPAQHAVFQVDNTKGLSNVLAGSAKLEDVAIPTKVEGLLLVPSGPVPDNPIRLLRGEEMQKFMDEALAVADFVIFDSPAGVAFADATVLASYAKRVLMVQSAGRVPRGAESEFKARLEQVGAELLGVVLNKVRPDDSHGVYHFRSAYASLPGRRGGGSSGSVPPTSPAIPS